MPPKKRAAEDDGAGPTTRSAKAPKTDASPPKAGRTPRGKKGPKANLGATSFKARALPIHINITHTPPVLADDDTVTVASTDPGFIGTATLTPGTFSTGSYGWKGSKRFTVELDNPDGGDKEKVHVMLTLNATVIGSKGAVDGEAEAEAEEQAEKAAEPATVEGETAEVAADAEEASKDANNDAKDAMEEVKEDA